MQALVPKDGVELGLVSGMGVCAGVIGTIVFAPVGLIALSGFVAGGSVLGVYKGWKAGTKEIDIGELAPELIFAGVRAAMMTALRERITKDLSKFGQTVVVSVSTVACDIILRNLILNKPLPSAQEFQNESVASIAGTFFSSQLSEFIEFEIDSDNQLESIFGKALVEGGVEGGITQIARNCLNNEDVLKDVSESMIDGSIQKAIIKVASAVSQQTDADSNHIHPVASAASKQTDVGGSDINKKKSNLLQEKIVMAKDLGGGDRDPLPPEEGGDNGGRGNPRPGKDSPNRNGGNPRDNRIDKDNRQDRKGH